MKGRRTDADERVHSDPAAFAKDAAVGCSDYPAASAAAAVPGCGARGCLPSGLWKVASPQSPMLFRFGRRSDGLKVRAPETAIASVPINRYELLVEDSD